MGDLTNEARLRLIERTRLRMEEWTRGERTDFLLEEGSEDRAFYPIVRYIDEYLDEAACEVLSILPPHRLQECLKDIPLEGTECREGVGYIPMPEDWIKLEGLRLRSWTRTVSEVAKVGTDEWILQQHRHTRGIQDKPVVGLAYGKLEVYSMRSCDEVVYAKYVNARKAEECPEKMFPLISLQCAILTEGVFGDDYTVQRLQQQLQTMLETLNI
jgi:hypothetical protein